MERVIYLAGGCFWGLEKAFQALNGVKDTEVGYANGNIKDPTYELVKTNTTGFRETVKIIYDDEIISLDKILKAFFICIDPTQNDGQKHDIGSQYLTGVYYTDDSDEEVIREYFLEERKKHPEFYTEYKKLENFYTAEEYHQDYLIKNPGGYCHISKREYEEVRKLNEE